MAKNDGPPFVRQWEASNRLNLACRKDIDALIRKAVKRGEMEPAALKSVIQCYGIDRVQWILASTHKVRRREGGFANDNLKWSQAFGFPELRKEMAAYSLKGDTEMIIELTRQAREYFESLGLYNAAHIREQGGDESLVGKVLILHPEHLRDEFKRPEHQLILAAGGFGCNPGAVGRMVYGTYLWDDDARSFYAGDFYGIMREELLPEWCREKLEYGTQDQEQGASREIML